MLIEKPTLGAAIRRVRRARGLTQSRLAEKAGLAHGGKSVALIEQGRRFVSIDKLNAIAKALAIPPACLAMLGSNPSRSPKALDEFVKSLQRTIMSVIEAQESLESEQATQQAWNLAVPSTRLKLATGVRERAKKRAAARR